VEGTVTSKALIDLTNGVAITIDGKIHQTMPAQATLLPFEPAVPERNPPIRFRKNIPTSWVELTLHEGKNRQVRKMTAAVGFPTLRLIRKSIEGVELGDMQPGDVKELSREIISLLLFRK
jgi:23S rRNA pseudouridine2457 synthase